MRNLIREILLAVIAVIREEIAFRRFLRSLKRHPPEENAWRDAVSKITFEEWSAKVEALGYGFSETPLDTLKRMNAKDKKRNEIKKRYFTQKLDPKPHAKHKRTKFQKRWPHGKHSG